MIEFDHLTGLDIDEMFMMFTGFLIAGAAITKLQTLDDTGFLEKLDCAVDSRDGNGAVFVDGAHTGERGIVKHRNCAGAEAGATLIVTFRRHVSSAFANLSEAQRLFVQTGIALFH